MTQIAQSKALDLLRSFNGRIFVAEFVKKNGDLRKMVARLGVNKAKGTGNYSHTRDLTRDNVTVYEMANRGQYRAIPLDRVISIRHAGQTYSIN